jgi:glutathione S-transferase
MAAALEFVDLAVARDAPGVRIAVSGLVPSPWSEAAKGLFRLQGVPVMAVRSSRGPELAEWTKAHNVPVVFCDREPPRASWAAILALAVRLGDPDVLLPHDVASRAATVGMIHEIAGEDGLGWGARLAMIHASFTSQGARGFPLPVAQYLGGKYGYAPDRLDAAHARSIAVLDALADRLGTAEYFGGARPNALDVYTATFLTPVTEITEAACPKLSPALRAAFATAHEQLGPSVPAALYAHHRRMFDAHLAWPIEL